MRSLLLAAALALAVAGVACGSPEPERSAEDIAELDRAIDNAVEQQIGPVASAREAGRVACGDAYYRLPGDTNAVGFANAYADIFAADMGATPSVRDAAYEGCLAGLGGVR